jgi:hypothetical protein
MNCFLPRTVVVLGLVSMLNDTASEMITPLLPLFLPATLGAGPAIIGLVEGVAEATASILKLISGWQADPGWNRKRLVVGGYTVSNTARPLISFALGWEWVLMLRFMDRVGKGLRTAPRDALIAASTYEHVFMTSVIPGIALVFLVVLGLKTPAAVRLQSYQGVFDGEVSTPGLKVCCWRQAVWRWQRHPRPFWCFGPIRVVSS